LPISFAGISVLVFAEIGSVDVIKMDQKRFKRESESLPGCVRGEFQILHSSFLIIPQFHPSMDYYYL
jgi:hypothetical protein